MKEQRILLPNSIQLHVKHSEGDKPAVLFLHFSGGTSDMWHGILPQFAADYRIIAPDLRGHGRSDKPDTGYHIDDMAHDVYLLLTKLNIERCHIVGSSMGAEVGLSLAASHPKLIDSFICEGALYNEFGEWGMFNGSAEENANKKAEMKVELSKRQVPVCRTKEEFVMQARAPFEQQGLWNEQVAAFVDSTAMEAADGSFTSHYSNRVRTEYIEKYWELRFEDYYQKLKCPVLFLPSEEEWSNEQIRASMKHFATLVPSYEVLRIPESLHAYVWMQKPQEAGAAAKSFIDRVEDDRGDN
ncbi:alpha/beta fold hydrolase [Paenibacillus turpanensis]|uniref:alpha/beta fold hydrolase n=1 Tax=Paenibacillus turpanensis TaxID=2689078 RepID=UPI001408C912|nr:alpha/beta hydrolase [Paenibacillus turpanensis]